MAKRKRPAGGKPSCGGRGGVALCGALQREVARRDDLVGVVAVTPCGCLGPCFDGPNLVVYPEGVWLAGATEADVAEIVGYLAGGPVPARLRWDGADGDDDDDDDDDDDGAGGGER